MYVFNVRDFIFNTKNYDLLNPNLASVFIEIIDKFLEVKGEKREEGEPIYPKIKGI